MPSFSSLKLNFPDLQERVLCKRTIVLCTEFCFMILFLWPLYACVPTDRWQKKITFTVSCYHEMCVMRNVLRLPKLTCSMYIG